MTENDKRNWVNLPFETVDMRDSVGICSECPLACAMPISHVPFEIVGSNPKPDILFIAEAPFKDEIKQQRPLIGKAGSFLRDVIGQYIDSYALANVVSCHPTNTAKIGVRTPHKDEQEFCVEHVHAFIEEIQPKLIVMLGRIAYENILPEQYLESISKDAEYVGRMQKKGPIISQGITYACSYHPSYITRSGGIKSKSYDNFNSRIKRIIRSISKDSLDINIDLPDDRLEIEFVPYSDLCRVLDELEEYNDIGLDFEARTLDPWFAENKPTGFSLSVSTGPDSGKSYYIMLDSFYKSKITKENTYDYPLISERFINFCKRKGVWTYNAKYETNMTWATFGEHIKFNDTFTLCKIDCSPQSLKLNAQKYLDADLWEEEVYSIVSYFEFIFGQITKHKATYPEITNLLISGNKDEACKMIHEDVKIAKKFAKLLTSCDALLELITNDDFKWGLTKYPYQWAAVPTELLGVYCSWDSYLTIKLKNLLWPKYIKQYQYYITQTWLAGNMEAYGYNWNDEIAKNHSSFYIIEAVDCLYELIKRIDISDEELITAELIYNDPDPDLTPKKKLNKLKEIFNPLSNLPEKQDKFWRTYRTSFTETIAFMKYLHMEVGQNDILDDDVFLPLIKAGKAPDLVVLEMFEACGFSKRKRGAIDKIINGLERNLDFYFRRFAIEITKFHYESHTEFGGVNIDNEETWNEPFYMMYYLKRFKKVVKVDSTYIWGEIGRKSVWLSEISDRNYPPRRIANYYDVPNHKLKPNQRWILNANFFECGADTKRWRAGIHTVPSSSELRDIYEPRTNTSIMLHADYAQNEVRFLAKMAEEKNLMAAFERGVDVHRFVASNIFKKPEREISDIERSYAKAATFGLLYGKTVASFAQEMMGGDLAGAKKFFAEFFAAFPGIKRFVDAQHAQVLEHGFVYTLFGDPININTEFYREDEVLRRAQNYPIQSYHGNTPVVLLDGKSVTIQEMAENPSIPYYGWAVDKETCEYIPVQLESPQLTDYKQDWIRVTLDDGQEFETTVEHLWILRDGKEIRADHLEVNMSLMPLYLEKGKYLKKQGNYLTIPKEFSNSNEHIVHKKVANQFLGNCPVSETGFSYNVHHKNEDTLNNSPWNLEYINASEHSMHHLGMNARQQLNLSEDISDEDAIAQLMSYKNQNREDLYPEWHKNQKDAVSREVNKRFEEMGSVLGIDDPEERSRIHKEKVWRQHRETIIEGLKKGHNTKEAKKNHSNASKDREKSPEYRVNRIRKHIQLMKDNGLDFSTPKSYDESIVNLVEQGLVSKFQKRLSSWLLEVIPSWDEVLENFKISNHKIAKIERIHYEVAIPTYDICVPKYMNFAIGQPTNGVFCHNSSASSLGAHAIYLLNEGVMKRGINAVPLGFCHDACDWDIEIYDLFNFIPLMHSSMVDYIKKRFGIPVGIDLEVGINQNFMMKLEPEGDKTYKFKCAEAALPKIIERMETVFTVEYEITEKESKYKSLKDLFINKGAFSKFFGTDVVECKGIISIS